VLCTLQNVSKWAKLLLKGALLGPVITTAGAHCGLLARLDLVTWQHTHDPHRTIRISGTHLGDPSSTVHVPCYTCFNTDARCAQTTTHDLVLRKHASSATVPSYSIQACYDQNCQ
jgi:hypothetical protein